MKRRVFDACILCVLAAIFAGSSVRAGAAGPADPRRAVSLGYLGGLINPPLPKPRFLLSDTSGAPFDFRARTEGYVTLLFFGYTRCPAECPMHVANVAMALRAMPAEFRERVKLVFVTTDP